MSYDIARVREQGMNLVVICVNDSILDSPSRRQEVWRAFQAQHGVPTAIVGAQRHRVFGDRRIVPWLESIELSRLPWRRVA